MGQHLQFMFPIFYDHFHPNNIFFRARRIRKNEDSRLGEAEIHFPLAQEGRIGHEHTNNFDLFVSCQVEQQKHNVFF